jgi:putative transposase
MIDFVAEHRDEDGVESICAQLPIAPSTYHEHAARRGDPELRPWRERRDEALLGEIQRVHGESFDGTYGAKKVWRQPKEQEGHEVARCTVERLMQKDGLQGAGPRVQGDDDAGRREGTTGGPGAP